MRIPSRFRIMSASFALTLIVIGLAIFSTSLITGHAAGTGSSTDSKVSMRPQATSTATNNCGYWKAAASTNVPSTNDYFNSSTVLAINGGELVTHVWAVGYYTDSSTGNAQTLIEHRHGTTWTVIPSPNPGVNNILTAVMAITSTDVWAVGYSYTSDPSVDGQTLILNWDGTSWNIFPSPNPGTANTLNALIQIPNSSDIWAVGSSDGGTLTIQWDGTNWNTIPSANPVGGTAATLTSVTAFTPKSAWAVGYYTDSNGQKETLIEKWTGTQWKTVTSLNVAGANGSALTGVSRVYSSTQVWAVGYSYTTDPVSNTTTYQTLAEFFDGSNWNIVASPSSGSSAFAAVSVVTTNTVWAVGYSTNSNGVTQTLVERWDGTSWSIVASPNVGKGNNALRGMGRVPGNDAFFAVGARDNTSTSLSQTLVETYCR